MPTKCTRPVIREVADTDPQGRRLIVTIYPNGEIGIRPKGTRTEFTLMASTAYATAAEIEGRAAKAEKRRSKRVSRSLV